MAVEHTVRTRDGGTIKVKLSRTKAIKVMCTECCGYGEFHPKECTDVLCPLYPFRGKVNIAYKDGDSDPTTEPDDDEGGEDEV